MKKTIIIIVAVLVLAIAGWFLGTKFLNLGSQDDFLWGITLRSSPHRKYHSSTWIQQIKYVKELGVGWVRLGVGDEKNLKDHDQMINLANAQGLQIYLNFGEAHKVPSMTDPYQEGYKQAKEIATRYKGKVKYYQLLSESASTALKGGQYPGTSEDQYDSTKYEKIKEWLKGASKGIRESDSKAKIIITDQWTHFAFFEMIKRDKVDYDILGWDWFSDMGLLEDKKLDDGTLVFDHLKKIGKPIMLVEVNARPDEKLGQNEVKQVEYIEKMADFAWKNRKTIKGFFVLELADLAPSQSSQKKPEYYGLIKFKVGPDGGYTFGEKRKAFDAYKNIIEKYSK